MNRALLVLGVLVVPSITHAQSPRVLVGAGVHAQDVGGAAAAGVVLEAGVHLRVAPMLIVRPEGAWVRAPSQGPPAVFAPGRGRSGAGGHPHLFFAGVSLIVSRENADHVPWYILAGGAVAYGRGNYNWVATRPAFAPHLGLGWRPLADRPRLGLELRGRYAPVWFDAPLRYVGLVTVWAF